MRDHRCHTAHILVKCVINHHLIYKWEVFCKQITMGLNKAMGPPSPFSNLLLSKKCLSIPGKAFNFKGQCFKEGKVCILLLF